VRDTFPPQRWSADNFPPETGKVAVVTCSTSGLGFELALALAQAGADVIVTGPNQADGQEAIGRIRPLAQHALVRFEKLNLESLTSVADFANRLVAAGRPIDLLVNTASTLALLDRQVTKDGFELHLGTNYLSHFALTARLLPLLRSSRQPRVVQVTGPGRHHGEINVGDLQLLREYTPLKAYSQSKLAMLIFAVELQRQSDAHGWGLVATAAQPIGAQAAHMSNAPEVVGTSGWYRRALGLIPHDKTTGTLQLAVSPAEEKERRTRRATTPKRVAELIGPPTAAALDLRVLDAAMASYLWGVSTKLTNVEWPNE
jgi:NAD(P)-dependent dehydrogenase (short-subunit alcohol dehydrogenase family)